MTTLPTINALTPSATPEVPAVNYHAMWITGAVIGMPTPERPKSLKLTLHNYDGAKSLDPDPKAGFVLNIADLDAWNAMYGPNNKVATAMAAFCIAANAAAPVKSLADQVAAVNQSIATAEQALAQQQSLLARANSMPASDIKTQSITTAAANIAKLQGKITAGQAQLVLLNASLATAVAALTS